jgi:hypothetical protein
MPRSKMPGTLKRSPKKAQDSYEETLESAEEQYGDDERAHRTAYASLKHSFEKVGDHWEPKRKPGPSDPRSARPTSPRRTGETAGGVDVEGHTKAELYERARKLDIPGRSKLSKLELAQAIARKQD